jgi:hypothetical protein
MSIPFGRGDPIKVVIAPGLVVPRARIVQITGPKVQVSDRTADFSPDREISVTGPLAAVKAALTLVVQQIVEAQ